MKQETNKGKRIQSLPSLEDISFPKLQNDYITDPDFKQYKSSVNRFNKNLFLIASMLEGKAKKYAYKIASRVKNSGLEQEVLKLFREYTKDNENTEKIFRDICKHLSKVNQYNISLFAEIVNIKNEIESEIAHEIILKVNNSNYKKEVIKIIESYKNNGSKLFGDSDFFDFITCSDLDLFTILFNHQKQISRLNEYNLALYEIATNFSDQNTKDIAFKIASLVNDRELKKEVLKLFNYIKNNGNEILNNKVFQKNIEHLNKHNISIYLRAARIKNKKARENGYRIASKVIDKLSKEKADIIFDALKSKILPIECFNSILLNMNLIFSDYINEQNNSTNKRENSFFYTNHRDTIKLIDLSNNQNIDEIPLGTLCYKDDELFIKNKSNLSKLNISKTDFDFLFPGQTLLRFSQGYIGDCFLLSSINGLINSDNGLEIFLNFFSRDGSDLYITLPSHERINIDTILSNIDDTDSINGSLGWKIFEKAFSLFNDRNLNNTESGDLGDIDYSYDHIEGGNPTYVFHKLQLYNTDEFSNNQFTDRSLNEYVSSINLFDTLKNYLNNNYNKSPIVVLGTITNEEFDDSIINEMSSAGIAESHAYTLIKIEDENLFISDPHNTAGYIVINREIFEKYFSNIYCCIINNNLDLDLDSPQHVNNNDNNIRSYNWWKAKIYSIEDRPKRDRLLVILRKCTNSYDAYRAISNSNQDPNIILNNEDIFQHLANIDITNLNLYIKASELIDKNSRLKAYNLISENQYLLDTNGMLLLLEFLKKNESSLLNDNLFSKYCKKVNEYNYQLFVVASTIQDPSKRNAAYLIVSGIVNTNRQNEALNLIYKLKESNIKLKPLDYYKYFGVMNIYNELLFEKIFNINFNINNEYIKYYFYEIAKHVNNEKLYSDAKIILELYANKNINLFNIFQETEHLLHCTDINEHNISLLAKASKIEDNSLRDAAVSIILNIKSKEGEAILLDEFNNISNGSNHLLHDIISRNNESIEEKNKFNLINDFNILLFIRAGEIENKQLRQIAYNMILQINTEQMKKDALKLFTFMNNNSDKFLNDSEILECFNNVNSCNIQIICRAINFSNPDAIIATFKVASYLSEDSIYYNELLQIVDKLENNDEEVLRNIGYIQYTGMINRYNKEIFNMIENLPESYINNNSERILDKKLLFKLASYVDNREKKQALSNLIDLILKGTNDILDDNEFCSSLKKINSKNFILFVNIALIDNKNIRDFCLEYVSRVSTSYGCENTKEFISKLNENNYSLIKDTFEKYSDNIHQFNIDLFIYITNIQNENARNVACEMIAKLIKIQYFHDQTSKQFELLQKNGEILLNDPDFYSYFSKLNDYNIKLFIEAATNTNINEKLKKYEEASHIG